MVASLHQLAAREAKAKRIADWLIDTRPDIDAELASFIDPRGRDLIAHMAGCNPPSEQTWQIVVGRLRRPLRPVRSEPADPWTGLPGADR